MRQIATCFVIVMSLAACGGDGATADRDLIARACRSDGSSEAACSCLATEAAKLDPAALHALALGSAGKSKEKEADAAMNALPDAAKMSIAEFSGTAIETCGLGAKR